MLRNLKTYQLIGYSLRREERTIEFPPHMILASDHMRGTHIVNLWRAKQRLALMDISEPRDHECP